MLLLRYDGNIHTTKGRGLPVATVGRKAYNRKMYSQRAEKWQEKADEIEKELNEPVANSGESGIIKSKRLPLNIQLFAKIPKEKFTKYALDPIKQPDKAKAFKEALGYSIDNYQELIDNIQRNFNE